MGRSHYHVLDKIVFTGGQAGYAFSSPLLGFVSAGRYSLDISQVGESDADFFFFDQVFFVDFLGVCLDLGPSLICPFIFYLKKFIFYNSHELVLVSQ